MILANHTRRGATTAETALVLPIVCLFVISFIVGGMTVFNHQQVTCLAREGARWASVRGSEFSGDTQQDSPTQQQIFDNAIKPLAAGLAPTSLAAQVELVTKSTNTAQSWDSSTKSVRSITTTGEYVSNTVRVTVTYQVTSVFGQPLTLTGVCELPMSN